MLIKNNVLMMNNVVISDVQPIMIHIYYHVLMMSLKMMLLYFVLLSVKMVIIRVVLILTLKKDKNVLLVSKIVIVSLLNRIIHLIHYVLIKSNMDLYFIHLDSIFVKNQKKIQLKISVSFNNQFYVMMIQSVLMRINVQKQDVYWKIIKIYVNKIHMIY